jgi:cysteine desulfurase
MEIYFDNAASTPVCAEAAAAIADTLQNVQGNPSSGHAAGRLAERRLRESRAAVAGLLGVPEDGLVFTSGGTESNGLAILGTVKRPGSRIITSAGEHPSVLDCYRALSERGADAVYLRPDRNGAINQDELAQAINERTVLVSFSHVNHETGAAADVAGIGAIIKSLNRDTVFHVDAVQSCGKHVLPMNNVDLVSVSAHKMHGPKGTGAL